MANNALDWLSIQCHADCHKCAFAPFIRRCLTTLGWPMSKILLHKVADTNSAVLALSACLREWLDSGVPASTGQLRKGVRAAMLHRVLPQVRPGLCGTAWAAKVGGTPSSLPLWDNSCTLGVPLAFAPSFVASYAAAPRQCNRQPGPCASVARNGSPPITTFWAAWPCRSHLQDLSCCP